MSTVSLIHAHSYFRASSLCDVGETYRFNGDVLPRLELQLITEPISKFFKEFWILLFSLAVPFLPFRFEYGTFCENF